MDVLLIDTAGRLHNKAALMEELAKVIRVMRKQDPTAPHSVLLVLDATTGHNAIEQVRVFKDMVAVTGLIVTKLDAAPVAASSWRWRRISVCRCTPWVWASRPVTCGRFEAMDFARGLVGGRAAVLAGV